MITPMKKIKGNLDNFKIMTMDNFHYLEFNQRDEKVVTVVNSDYSDHTKKIKAIISDLKYIFKSKDDSDNSICITFDYLNKEDNLHSIQISATNKNGTKNSVFYSVKDFNELFNSLNKDIRAFIKNNKTNNMDSFIINLVIDKMIKNEFDINVEVDRVSNSIEDFLSKRKKSSGIDDLKDKLDKNKEYLEKSILTINSIIEGSADYRKLKELKKMVKDLEESINDRTMALCKKYKIEEVSKSNVDIDKSIRSIESNMRFEVNSILAKEKTVVAKKIKL